MRGLNIHTHTHTNEIDYLGSFFFFSLYILDILNLKNFFFFVLIFECRWVGNVYSYLCSFLPFPSFLLSLFLSSSFSFFSPLVARRVLIAFFFLSSSSARFPTPSSLDSFLFFFHQVFFSSWSTAPLWKRYALTPTTLSLSSNHVFFLAGRWSTSGWGGNAHFLPPHKNTIEGDRRK